MGAGARLHLAAACLALALPVLPRAAPGDVDVPLAALAPRLETSAGVVVRPDGLALVLAHQHAVVLPFAAEELELDLEGDPNVLLSWTTLGPEPLGVIRPPWRYRLVPRARATVRLDLRQTDGWDPSRRAVLLLDGAGTVVIHRLAAHLPPADAAAALDDADRARRWASESVDHRTVNVLTPSWWSERRGVWLADAVAALAAAVGLAVAFALRRRERGTGIALVAGAAVAFAAWDVHLLVRLLPALASPAPALDPEVRLRDGYPFAPEVGALAVAARAALRPGERVGAMADDWFAPEALCFDLAPRPCAILQPGQRVHPGLGGVGRLRDDELDALVGYGVGPPPPGFAVVARTSPRAWVARRR